MRKVYLSFQYVLGGVLCWPWVVSLKRVDTLTVLPDTLPSNEHWREHQHWSARPSGRENVLFSSHPGRIAVGKSDPIPAQYIFLIFRSLWPWVYSVGPASAYRVPGCMCQLSPFSIGEIVLVVQRYESQLLAI